MLLKEFTITNIGPFSEPTIVTLEEDVTVLTGANDSGKTSILNAIELLCDSIDQKRTLQESEVNLDRIGYADTEWKSDEKITCKALFQITKYSNPHIGSNLEIGAEISVTHRLAPQYKDASDLRFRSTPNDGWRKGGGVMINKMPSVIRLPLDEPIRAVIDLQSPNQTELDFLRAAFGPEYSFNKYKALTDGAFYSALSKARGDTNEKINRFLSPVMSLEFDFQTVNGQRDKLSVQLRDGYSGHTPLGMRGSGIRTLVSLMAALLSKELEDRHYIILIDEPENSLHADAQHSLRSVLEGLASKPNVQVVYATHSPSMINPILTSSLRLTIRENNGKYATVKVVDRPIDQNFLSVRSSLGITASDSLLYGPVTLIVEGPSEVLGIPIILKRLWEAEIEGFEDVGVILPQIHLLDGCGDSFDRLCKVAATQGTKPVVFLDGDKAGSRLNGLRRNCPDVPVILLEGRSEFEEIVLPEFYFDSLAKVMREFSEDAEELLQESKYREWNERQGYPEQMAFSKRVDRWVEEAIGLKVEKPLVMKQVLSNTPLESVKTDKLKELLDHLRAQL